jgi:nitrogen PTS system EIIA component
MTPATPDIHKLLRITACAVGVAGDEKDSVLAELVGVLVRSKQLQPGARAGALRALLERERVASTGVGLGVAIPHVQLRGLEQVAFALCVTAAPVPWQAHDGAGVRIVFGVLRPEKAGPRFDPQRHLELMRGIAQLGRDADFRRFACGVTDRNALLALVQETVQRLRDSRT